LIPKDAQVEIAAKVAVGYHGGKTFSYKTDDLKSVAGRAADQY